MLLAKSTSRVGAARCGRTSRFRPFTCSTRQRMCSQVVKAAEEVEAPDEPPAEEESPIVDEDFVFNYSEAKRNNEYQPSDVAAALAFYADGVGDMPYDADFVGNPLGLEDAALFDDVDNNEAYAADEFASAGISEAAPKAKGGQQGRKRPGEEEGLSDEQLEDMEGAKLTAAALDEVGVAVEDEELDVTPAAWEWDEPGSDAAGAWATATEGAVGAAGDEEDALIAELAALDMSQVEDVTLTEETRDLVALLVNEVAADADALDEDDEGELAEADVQLEPAEEAAIDELVGEELPPLRSVAELPLLPDAPELGAPLEDAEVDAYLAALRGVAAGGEAALTEALAGSEAPEEVVVGEVEVPVLALPPLPEGADVADLLKEDAAFEAALDADAADEADLPTEAILGVLEEIAAIPAVEYSELLLPEEQDLVVFEDLLDATTGYMDALGAEATEPLAADAVDDDFEGVNMFDDAPADLVQRASVLEDEGDGTQAYVERVLELSRVTKVVKGGKIQGFRAVVVVGNGAGRVGVGCQSAREVGNAVKRALTDARKHLIQVPLVGAGTLPHRVEAWHKGAGVVMVPAADGTGVIAGSSIRSVLELAGVQNVLAKRLGSRSQLNNARVALAALQQLRTLEEVAETRDLPLAYLLQ